MPRQARTNRRDESMEARIGALPINAAHREMALLHYRRAVEAADRAADWSENLRSFATTIRMGLEGRPRRAD